MLGRFEFESVERRLQRAATLLRIDGAYKDYLQPGILSRDIEAGCVHDATEHAFAAAHDVRAAVPDWIAYFESVATAYLRRLSQSEPGRSVTDPL